MTARNSVRGARQIIIQERRGEKPRSEYEHAAIDSDTCSSRGAFVRPGFTPDPGPCGRTVHPPPSQIDHGWVDQLHHQDGWNQHHPLHSGDVRLSGQGSCPALSTAPRNLDRADFTLSS